MKTLAAVVASGAAANAATTNSSQLPLPAHNVPANLYPPLTPGGRNDVHGWLWLPIDNGANESSNSPSVSTLEGYFYHHTPEFWWNSPHNFEIMVSATLHLDHPVANLPLPPAADAMNTEYVFTPPAFSLNELITQKATSFYGHFTNGSFDTPQYYYLSNGTLDVHDLPTVHYLLDDNHTAVPAMKQQAYLSYPRATAAATATATATASNQRHTGLSTGSDAIHLYWLHMLQRAPDYDQIVHVTVDPASCVFRNGDSVADVTGVGATFVTSLENDVMQRLHDGEHTVELFTEAGRQSEAKSTCNATVIREVHCVVMPDSFKTCPTL